ncbi:MAG: signal peptidase I [Microgenomates group bacterium]
MSKKVQLIITLVFAGGLISLITVFKPVALTGPAMEPGFKNGDRYLANKFAYLFSSPQRGDVVVFRYSQHPTFKGMSRVIGLPNEKLMIKDGKVFINSSQLEEIYLTNSAKTVTANRREIKETSETEASLEEVQGMKILEEGQEILIPDDSYFMMGDNRENSVDSRSLGFVVKKDIEVKIAMKY